MNIIKAELSFMGEARQTPILTTLPTQHLCETSEDPLGSSKSRLASPNLVVQRQRLIFIHSSIRVLSLSPLSLFLQTCIQLLLHAKH